MNNIILDLHIFQKICLKLKEAEDIIKELHELMDKVKVVEAKEEESYGTTGEES